MISGQYRGMGVRFALGLQVSGYRFWEGPYVFLVLVLSVAPIVLSCLAWKPTDSGGFHFVCLEISPTKAALKTKHTSMTEACMRAEINRNQPEAAVVKGLFG